MTSQVDVFKLIRELGAICRKDIVNATGCTSPNAISKFNKVKEFDDIESFYVIETINNRKFAIEYIRMVK